MSPIEAVVVAVCSLNLLLTLAVVRRLREHSERLDRVAALEPVSVQTGDTIAAFTAATVDGEPTCLGDLADGGLIAVLSPGCGACEEAVPGLKHHLTRPGRLPALVVIAGDPATAAPIAEELRAHAPVVIEAPVKGTVQRALGVREYPSLVALIGDRVTAVGNNIVDLPGVLATLPGAAR